MPGHAILIEHGVQRHVVRLSLQPGHIAEAVLSQRHPEGQPLHQPDALRGRELRPKDGHARLAGTAEPRADDGARDRLRIGPLLFEAERPGTEVLHPVAVVIFSGLISATLLDTFLTPAMFWLLGCKPAAALMNDKNSEAL